jgi:hypothetical protein
MRTGIVVRVTAADRDRLEAIVADRNSPQKHVWRARIVLATADGLGTMAVMQAAGKSKTAVWGNLDPLLQCERRLSSGARAHPQLRGRG